MDLGRLIRERVEAAVASARTRGPRNIATATNVSSTGHTTSVYSDDDVTIIERDGHRQVIHHGENASRDDATPGNEGRTPTEERERR